MNLHHIKNCRSKAAWTHIHNLKTSWQCLGGIKTDWLMILNSVWAKEIGFLANHCQLLAVKKGSIIIKAASPAAAQEFTMRSPQLIRSLNKYFNRPWIHSIKMEKSPHLPRRVWGGDIWKK